MGQRLDLQSKLEELLGARHVYYMPPENVKLEYPAIVYAKNKIDTDKADNSTYKKSTQYTVTVVDRMPDNDVIEKLMKLPYCSFDRHYVSKNLNHDVLTLYY